MAKQVTVLRHSLHFARPREEKGWVTHEASAFATFKAGKGWTILHRQSGLLVGSLLPVLPRPITRAECLSTICLWEASGLPLDKLNSAGFGKPLDPDAPGMADVIQGLRNAAYQVIHG